MRQSQHALGLGLVSATLLLAATPFSGAGFGVARAAPSRVHVSLRPCPPAGSELLFATRNARLYQVRVSGSKVLGGCLVGRAPHQLADVFGTSRLRLGGRYAAFAVSGSDKTVQSFEIEVRDLANGRIVVSAPTGVLTDAEANPSAALGRTFTGIGPPTELVLSPNATIAWIARDIVRHPPPAQATYEVHLAGPHGMTRTLAAGPDIDPASLALASGIVYWTQAGSPKSANFS